MPGRAVDPEAAIQVTQDHLILAQHHERSRACSSGMSPGPRGRHQGGGERRLAHPATACEAIATAIDRHTGRVQDDVAVTRQPVGEEHDINALERVVGFSIAGGEIAEHLAACKTRVHRDVPSGRPLQRSHEDVARGLIQPQLPGLVQTKRHRPCCGVGQWPIPDAENQIAADRRCRAALRWSAAQEIWYGREGQPVVRRRPEHRATG